MSGVGPRVGPSPAIPAPSPIHPTGRLMIRALTRRGPARYRPRHARPSLLAAPRSFAGAVLHSDGLSTPRVIGIALNGNGTALIRDTDGGRLDGDTVYDRAVGPMQFIPSTWAGWSVDANGDGRADPFNIFDAAAAAA